MLLSYLSANRDENVFADPFRFDVGTRPRQAPGVRHRRPLLSRRAPRADGAEAFFRELLPRLESSSWTATPEYVATTFVGGPKRLPIRYSLK